MPDTGDSLVRKLPFSLEAEQSVLGSILIAPDSFNDIAGIVLLSGGAQGYVPRHAGSVPAEP